MIAPFYKPPLETSSETRYLRDDMREPYQETRLSMPIRSSRCIHVEGSGRGGGRTMLERYSSAAGT